MRGSVSGIVRSLAFATFVLVAFAWVPPYIDRAGLAALALGFVALALPSRPPRFRRAARIPVPPVTVPAYAPEEEYVDDLLERVNEYAAGGLAQSHGRRTDE
jgi:hypothetical protein